MRFCCIPLKLFIRLLLSTSKILQVHQITLNWPQPIWHEKYLTYILLCFEIWFRFALCPATFEVPCCSKLEMHRMTSEWRWTLNSQKYPVYAKYLLLEMGKIENVLNDLRMTSNTEQSKVSCKYIIAAYAAYPRGPDFASFVSTTSHFQDITHFIALHCTMLNIPKRTTTTTTKMSNFAIL